MIPGLDKLIDAILGTATAQLQDRIQRSEAVIKLLKRLNLDPDHPPADFTAIYQYALVEYGVGKPKPVLDLFRRPEIQQTFRQAFEQNNFPLLERVSHEVIEAHDFGDQIQQLGIDWRRELVAFSAVFIGIAKRSCTPAEVLRDQQVRSLHQHLVTLQERLDRLPTIEGIRTEMARLAGEEVLALPAAEQGNHWAQQCRAYALSQQMRGWFETLGFRFETYEHWDADYFEWVINIPVRRGRYDRILVRGMDGEAELSDVAALRQSVEQQRTDEGWLVTARRISRAARDEVEQVAAQNLGCYTLDELLDQDADFTGYLDWLEQEIGRRKIDQTYVPLACTKEEFDPVSKQRMGVSHYDERDGWIDGYIDLWLDDPTKEHISVLGEFGMGKTWFALHYAWQALQRYKQAKRRGLERPRLPLVIPLRDYAKAVSVESLFSEFFFRKYEIPIPGYSVFEQLNRMGKLLLIFDGFDEMAARVDRQEMINNFWELAKVVVPGAKVILTCRTEHFPEAKEGRALLNAELQASTKSLTGETPQFEVLELEKFSDAQIEQVLALQAQPATVEQVMGNPQLLDLARRPVMTELILEALPDIEAGKPIDMSRIYLYAVRRKMERDIKAERTFTSMAEKLYFLCELSWEMLSTDRMSINYREFPDRIRRLFGTTVQEEKDLDHWHYDMMGQTMLIRNADGDYTPAHRSLLEFFVAYKFAAELGAMAPDFLELAQAQSCLDTSREPQDYTWSSYFRCEIDDDGKASLIPPLQRFLSESINNLRQTIGQSPLSKAVIDLLLPMLTIDSLLTILNAIRNRTESEVGYIGGNTTTLIVKLDKAFLEGRDLSYTVIKNGDFANASLRHTSFEAATMDNCSFTKILSSVMSVALSPDCKLLATGDSSGAVYLWETMSRREVCNLQGHNSWVHSVAFNPCGDVLATGSYDKTIKLWNISSGTCLRTLQGHTDWIRSVTFSAQGDIIASASSDATVRLWNISTGECLKILQGHSSQVRSVALNPCQENLLASSGNDKTIRLWNVRTGECLKILQEHTNNVCSVALSLNGELLASGSDDETARIWRTSTGECLKILHGHTGGILSVVFNTQNNLLISSSADMTVRLWDVYTGKCIKILQGHTSWINSLSLNSQEILASSSDTTVRLWDINSGECLNILQGQANEINSVAFSPDGELIVSSSDDRTVRLWQISNGACLRVLRDHTDWVNSAVFSADGELLASGSADGTVRLWERETGKYLKVLRGHTRGVNSVAFSSDSNRLVSGSFDQTIRIWNIETGQCLKVVKGHPNAIWSTVFSPRGNLIASSSSDNTVKLWDLHTGECLRVLRGHSNRVYSVMFNPQGNLIASSSSDGTVRLWDALTGKCLGVSQKLTNSINSIAFSPQGNLIAAGSDDKKIHLLKVSALEPLKRPIQI